MALPLSNSLSHCKNVNDTIICPKPVLATPKPPTKLALPTSRASIFLRLKGCRWQSMESQGAELGANPQGLHHSQRTSHICLVFFTIWLEGCCFQTFSQQPWKGRRNSHYAHFTDEEIQAQRDLAICTGGTPTK